MKRGKGEYPFHKAADKKFLARLFAKPALTRTRFGVCDNLYVGVELEGNGKQALLCKKRFLIRRFGSLYVCPLPSRHCFRHCLPYQVIASSPPE